MLTYKKMEPLWDESRNRVPFSSSLNHSTRFWWLGECGHSWESTITNKKQFGCPVCAGKLIQSGVNDLESHYPLVAAEWHPTKNLLKPSAVSKKSSKNFWWICEKGHQWEAKILHRVNGSGCPYCTNHAVLEGFNDLKTTHPELIPQWNFGKNLVSPNKIGAGAKTKVWWICEKGHEWESRVVNRTGSKKTGCHECSGYRKLVKNSNAELEFPHLSEQWSSKDNGSLSDYVGNSLEEVYWRCEEGHEWLQSIRRRSRAHSRCPICSGHKLISGVNDLSTINPILAVEWHPDKNNHLSPKEVTSVSGKKVWWLGKKCGHEWEATIANRANGAGCFICKYSKSAKTKSTPKAGITDLLSQAPLVAAQWHPTKNTFAPNEVNVGSRKYAWWVCEKGHQWETRITYRTNKDASGCPTCAAKDFASKPEVAILAHIKAMFPSAQANVRTLLTKNQELDIYVPERKLAVEFNGLYWHDENHKIQTYHYDKWLACKEQGIQLIQVWEDDWSHNPEQIKSMLAHKLGFSEKPRISGRKTRIIELTTEQTHAFLTQNHIQGYAAGSIRLGLVERENLDNVVAAMVLKKLRGTIVKR